jgi:hypothetical protein
VTQKELVETLWRFLRGDMLVVEFEQWVYATKELEPFLGPGRYYGAIATIYSSTDEVGELRTMLLSRMRELEPARCMCLETANRAVLDIGSESEPFMRSMEERGNAGQPRWWLSCIRCRECGDTWLVGLDSRLNDVYCLKRLDKEDSARLLASGIWPADFDRYETLLRMGYEAGRSVEYDVPLESKELYGTIADLARERPGIAVSELAHLLHLGTAIAWQMARRVVESEHVDIRFDAR